MSRLTVDITDRQHQNLKALAALEGKTIRQFAIERLFPVHDGEDQAWDELGEFLRHRIGRGLAGEVSAKSVADIVAEELDGASRA